MGITRCAVYGIIAVALVIMGCATSPEDEQRRLDMEADIAEILSYPLDPLEYGEPSRCLSDHDYSSYRALDDQHLLFKGLKNRMWINTLRSRCPGLRPQDALVVRKFNSRRICRFDKFEIMDWFAGDPLSANSGIDCFFGDFQPISEQQLAEIEAVIKAGP